MKRQEFISSKNLPLYHSDEKDLLDIDEYIGTIQSMLNDYKKEHKLDAFDEGYKLLYPENNNDDDIKQ